MRSPEMRYAGQRSRVGSRKRGTASSVWLELRLGGGAVAGTRTQGAGTATTELLQDFK